MITQGSIVVAAAAGVPFAGSVQMGDCCTARPATALLLSVS